MTIDHRILSTLQSPANILLPPPTIFNRNLPFRSPPRPPHPWLWQCHKCRQLYKFAVLNRCLSCSHRFCGKCASEFDYAGWERYKNYWGVDQYDKENRACPEYTETEEEEDDTPEKFWASFTETVAEEAGAGHDCCDCYEDGIEETGVGADENYMILDSNDYDDDDEDDEEEAPENWYLQKSRSIENYVSRADIEDGNDPENYYRRSVNDWVNGGIGEDAEMEGPMFSPREAVFPDDVNML